MPSQAVTTRQAIAKNNKRNRNTRLYEVLIQLKKRSFCPTFCPTNLNLRRRNIEVRHNNRGPCPGHLTRPLGAHLIRTHPNSNIAREPIDARRRGRTGVRSLGT